MIFMGVFKKSTPQKAEVKVVPDEKDGTLPYVERQPKEDAEDVEGQLTLDVFQTADEIVVVAPVAGVGKEDVAITINKTDDHDEVLTIKGRRSFEFKPCASDYFTQECFWGNFSRSIILPEYVDTGRMSASFKNGILTIRIPKVEKIRTRMIKIKEE